MGRVNAKRAAEITGDTVRTVQAHAALGLVPGARKNLAGHWTFDETRLRAWVEAGKPEPEYEPPYTGPTRDGQVYVFRCRTLAKIGWSRNVGVRLRHIQRSSPYPVKLVTAFPGEMALELSLHQRFAAQRVHGEWFKWRGAVARWVANGCQL